ncbi:MAG: YnfA family protein, partial [Deltaproteobacteria bacterium]|nr:YnfA family protein [Deltaproteobacteria bacterium]
WLLMPAAFSLALFSWLLSLHPAAAGRTYAAYGGVYVFSAVLWLWLVENQRPDLWDLCGAAISLCGMALIAFAPHRFAV